MRNLGIAGLGLFVAFMVGCGGAKMGDKAAAPSAPRYAESSRASEPAPSHGGGDPSAGMPAPPADAPSTGSIAKAPMPTSPLLVAPAGAAKAESAPTTPMPIAPVVREQRLPQAGQLTAGVWDDNLNFNWYLAFLASPAGAYFSGCC